MIYIIFWFLVQRLASVAFLESMQKLAETTDKSNKIKEQWTRGNFDWDPGWRKAIENWKEKKSEGIINMNDRKQVQSSRKLWKEKSANAVEKHWI